MRENISLWQKGTVHRVPLTRALFGVVRTCRRHPRMSLTLHAATAGGSRHSAAVRKPGPVQAPEEDRLGKQGHVRGRGA